MIVKAHIPHGDPVIEKKIFKSCTNCSDSGNTLCHQGRKNLFMCLNCDVILSSTQCKFVCNPIVKKKISSDICKSFYIIYEAQHLL